MLGDFDGKSATVHGHCFNMIRLESLLTKFTNLACNIYSGLKNKKTTRGGCKIGRLTGLTPTRTRQTGIINLSSGGPIELCSVI